ncbi:MAG: SUF system NifU family Fe-S cluster assembly protein [Mariprofundales bacterium]
MNDNYSEFDIQELYQQIIMDHNKSPRNFGKLDHYTCELEGYNPLCGDKLTLYLELSTNFEDQTIIDVGFNGEGCAISTASASLMTEKIKGMPIADVLQLFTKMQQMLTSDIDNKATQEMGKLAALAGVRRFPSRIKCAILCWHTLNAALLGTHEAVSTE